MHLSLRLLLVMLVAAGTGAPLPAATTSSSQNKKSSKATTSVKKSAPAKYESTASKAEDAPANKKSAAEPVNEAPPTPAPAPAAVSTLSIEDIRDFDQYPKQIQSLVQSCLALTHLELGYLYGSSEPSKGGMDCSGTIYHVLHFQGLKDVPRQSDEMCQWVGKKSQLHLTPTATSFESEEFAALKPGDLLFWTSTTETTRKLPVTHVMVYLGKLKKSGKRIVFGSSDGRSYMGERRSGVSVFDFTLPRPESAKHFYGYGPTPGLLPVEPERPVIAAVTPAVVTKEAASAKETAAAQTSPSPAPKDTVAVKESATKPKETPAVKETPAAKSTVAVKESAAVQETPATNEEVRKAIAVSTKTPAASSSDSKTEVKKTTAADTSAKSSSSTKANTSSTPKKRSTAVTSTTRRRTPAQPQKSALQQRVDQTVNSVRRFFQQ